MSSVPFATVRCSPRNMLSVTRRTARTLSNARNAVSVFRSSAHTMKCHLSLRRRDGRRLAADEGDVRQRLVDVSLLPSGGYRVIRARCCIGGSEVAVLWEPTLIRIDAGTFVLQGFETAREQTVVQEWILAPYFAGLVN